jgi:hypothetical protein
MTSIFRVEKQPSKKLFSPSSFLTELIFALEMDVINSSETSVHIGLHSALSQNVAIFMFEEQARDFK